MSISTQVTVVATAEQIIVTAPGALRGPMGDVTPEVTQLVEDAQAAAAEAESFVAPVTEQASIATSAAERAELAADLSQLSAGIFADTATGLANTVSGQVFGVPSTEDESSVILYQNSAGVAVDTGQRYPSSTLIESKIPRVFVTNQMVPIFADDADQVPVWLDEGRIDAPAMGPSLRQDIGLDIFAPFVTDRIPVVMDDAEKVAVWLDKGALDGIDLGPGLREKIGINPFIPHATSLVPLVVDIAGKVAVWLDDGRIDSKSIGPGISAAVKVVVADAIANQPVDQSKLLTTTGKTLWLNKAKRGLLNSDVPAQLKVMFIGDSWSDLDTIPNKMADLLAKEYPKIGYGWISALLNRMTNGVTANRAGWTAYDASTTALPPTYGCAFDGASITTTLSTATANIINLPGTKVVIYYRGGPGIFRYRIDGGAWVVAPNGTDGAREKIVLDGLLDIPHTINIDTQGNLGTVTLYGFYATSGASGFEILKCGRGGLRGGQALKFLQYIPEYAADLQADLLIINLGTNDYRAGDVQGYIDGLSGFIDKHREGRPDIGIIVMSPPDSNGVAVVPLTLIRQLGQQVAASKGCEFADAHSIFPVYAKANALGLWEDDLHLSRPGADIDVNHVYDELMK